MYSSRGKEKKNARKQVGLTSRVYGRRKKARIEGVWGSDGRHRRENERRTGKKDRKRSE
jgi:hypothetical protein